MYDSKAGYITKVNQHHDFTVSINSGLSTFSQSTKICSEVSFFSSAELTSLGGCSRKNDEPFSYVTSAKMFRSLTTKVAK